MNPSGLEIVSWIYGMTVLKPLQSLIHTLKKHVQSKCSYHVGKILSKQKRPLPIMQLIKVLLTTGVASKAGRVYSVMTTLL
ncbi:hypothetical protein WQ57_07545 [Mesobacillus campisalis]|uniref:Uncharacterized protein n=1 Tax=Mesobacillus campisalis TaxID=1408103 RepID=A0A0M2SV59_9BACI|nr:hypothetical protein WQ57_07545 [Mesobacillus campisalis]